MLYKNKYRIETARLKEYDYSFPNWYYVTINTKDHREFLGRVVKSKFIPNKCGKIVDEEWNKISKIRSGVELDYYIVMPNHIHGIIIINESTELKTVKNKTHPPKILLSLIVFLILLEVLRVPLRVESISWEYKNLNGSQDFMTI